MLVDLNSSDIERASIYCEQSYAERFLSLCFGSHFLGGISRLCLCKPLESRQLLHIILLIAPKIYRYRILPLVLFRSTTTREGSDILFLSRFT